MSSVTISRPRTSFLIQDILSDLGGKNRDPGANNQEKSTGEEEGEITPQREKAGRGDQHPLEAHSLKMTGK